MTPINFGYQIACLDATPIPPTRGDPVRRRTATDGQLAGGEPVRRRGAQSDHASVRADARRADGRRAGAQRADGRRAGATSRREERPRCRQSGCECCSRIIESARPRILDSARMRILETYTGRTEGAGATRTERQLKRSGVSAQYRFRSYAQYRLCP